MIYNIKKFNELRVLLDLFNTLFKGYVVSDSRKGVFLVLNFKLNFRPLLFNSGIF